METISVRLGIFRDVHVLFHGRNRKYSLTPLSSLNCYLRSGYNTTIWIPNQCLNIFHKSLIIVLERITKIMFPLRGYSSGPHA